MREFVAGKVWCVLWQPGVEIPHARRPFIWDAFWERDTPVAFGMTRKKRKAAKGVDRVRNDNVVELGGEINGAF